MPRATQVTGAQPRLEPASVCLKALAKRVDIPPPCSPPHLLEFSSAAPLHGPPASYLNPWDLRSPRSRASAGGSVQTELHCTPEQIWLLVSSTCRTPCLAARPPHPDSLSLPPLPHQDAWQDTEQCPSRALPTQLPGFLCTFSPLHSSTPCLAQTRVYLNPSPLLLFSTRWGGVTSTALWGHGRGVITGTRTKNNGEPRSDLRWVSRPRLPITAQTSPFPLRPSLCGWGRG